jgi:glutamate-5-semialdehyde dehydrogenase
MSPFAQRLTATVKAMRILAESPSFQRDEALSALSQLLSERRNELEHDHQEDRVSLGRIADRIQPLTDADCLQAAQNIDELLRVADPLGPDAPFRSSSTGFGLMRWRRPVGLIGVAASDKPGLALLALAYALKTGNAAVVLLEPGFSRYTGRLLSLLSEALTAAGLPVESVLLVSATPDVLDPLATSPDIGLWLCLDDSPGAHAIRKAVPTRAIVPASGLRHMLVDRSADLEWAAELIMESRTLGPSVVLVHRAISAELVGYLAEHASRNSLLMTGCKSCVAHDRRILQHGGDWSHLPQNVAFGLREIADLEAGLEHIRLFGGGLVETLLCRDHDRQQHALRHIRAALVLVNDQADSPQVSKALGPNLGFARFPDAAVRLLDWRAFTRDQQVGMQGTGSQET